MADLFLSSPAHPAREFCFLPADFSPVRPKGFDVSRIVLTKGSLASKSRQQFVERIAGLYPQAIVEYRLNTSHNRLELAGSGAKAKIEAGKHTLVFGEHRSAVRFSEEAGNTCPNYWHFSPTGFCFFACEYCYLAGTPGVRHSPSVKIFVNLDEIIEQIDATANRLAKTTAFYLGKLQDGLALDPLTGFSERLVPFFAQHPYARQIVLTKADDVDRLLPLTHNDHTILSWSLNPQRVIDEFEEHTPSLVRRIQAMKACASQGYPVRAVVMPIVPVPDWKTDYESFVRHLLHEVPIRRLTLGGICSYPNARSLMESALGPDNGISRNLAATGASRDGRVRYPQPLRIAMYSHVIAVAREINPSLEIALCLEEARVWAALGLKSRLGQCNCVL